MHEISSDGRTGDAVASIAPLYLPDDRQLVMRTMPMPADANGKIGRASCRERVLVQV